MARNEKTLAAFVVTGASSGIGLACAMALDARGGRVFAGVRREADAQRLQSQASERLTPLMMDVTKPEAIAAAVRRVEETVGEAGIAGLVNNAGIAVAGPLEIVPLTELRRQLEVNVIGPIAATQAFLPLLRKARGRIVNMSSVSGRLAVPYLGPYAASKFALEALSDSLRIELRTWGIHVALVEPASIATPIWEKSLAAAEELETAARPEQAGLYREDLEALRRAVQHAAETAMPVERVVRAVLHALTARWPKTRYPVGLPSHLAIRLASWLPDRLRDWNMRRRLGFR